MGSKKGLWIDRSGKYVPQPSGYRTFVPKPLPPDPALVMDGDIIHLLSLADRSIGRLDAATDNLPDPDFFVYSYVVREAALSSQIEGTQATADDVFDKQAGVATKQPPDDVDEILNYVDAMKHGLEQLKTGQLPLSLRLIRDIHRKLLHDVRGQEKQPGELRKRSNWIGPRECTIQEADFVPPPPHEMRKAIGDLEMFIQRGPRMPLLIKCGLVHAQFETIHPFLDGNGRVGRLLITFMLCHAEVLTRPLLYLSHYFKEHRDEYYDRLQRVRDKSDWEGWLEFFLRAVFEVSVQATKKARQIVQLKKDHQRLLREKGQQRVNALTLLDLLYEKPIVNASIVAERLHVTLAPVYSLIRNFQKLELLHEITGRERNRIFFYQPYLDILNEQNL